MNRSRIIPPLGVALLGGVALAAGCVLEPRQAWNSYLIAYAYVLSTALGALLYAMTGSLTRARWFVVMRRPADSLAASIPLLAILFIPMLLAARYVWPWAGPFESLSPAIRAAVAPKRAWLSLPFFAVRAALYLATWVVVTVIHGRLSRQRDDGDAAVIVRQRVLSAAAMPAVIMTLTFASFDWFMSLDPAWHSTVYGLYVFAGGALSAVAAVTLLATLAYRAGRLPPEVSDDHFHAAGRLLLAMTVFWAYLAFFQYMLIWIADVPDEVVWVLARTRHGWGVCAVILAVTEFALPFASLLFRAVTRSPRRLGIVAAAIVAAHYVDVYWLLAPALRPDHALPRWTDVAALCFLGGLVAAIVAWRWEAAREAPLRDPNLEAALRYESP